MSLRFTHKNDTVVPEQKLTNKQCTDCAFARLMVMICFRKMSDLHSCHFACGTTGSENFCHGVSVSLRR